MVNFNCIACDRAFETKASLSSHKYMFHRVKSAKPNVVAITNTSNIIESRQNPRKVITSEDERRDQLMMAQILNLSDSDSDSDDSISLFSDGGNSPNTSNKRNRIPNSSDDEPPSKVARKKTYTKKKKRKRIINISDSDSESDKSIFSDDGNNPNTSNKRNRTPNSSDEEPPSKVARKKSYTKRKKRKRDRTGSDDSSAPRRKSRKRSMIHKHNKDEHVIIPKSKPVPELSPISRRTKILSDLVNEKDKIRDMDRISELEQQVEELKNSLAVKEIISVPKKKYSKGQVTTLDAQIADLKEEVEALRTVRACRDMEIEKLEELLRMEKHWRNMEKNNLVSEMTPLDKALNNSVTIDEINEIRHLINTDNLEAILMDDDKLSIIQKIISGMLEGVIPISNPQELAFSDDQKSFMKDLQNVGLDNIRELITDNVDNFYEVFQILDMSLKLVVKAFNKYGQNAYK